MEGPVSDDWPFFAYETFRRNVTFAEHTRSIVLCKNVMTAYLLRYALTRGGSPDLEIIFYLFVGGVFLVYGIDFIYHRIRKKK